MTPLEQEIQSRPDWAGLTDAEVAVALNAVQVRLHEEWINARTLADRIGPDRAGEIVASLKAMATNEQLSAATREKLALIVGWLIDPASKGLDAGSVKTREQLPAFVSAGVITADEAATIAGWAETRTVRAQQLLGREATEADVALARWQAQQRQAHRALLEQCAAGHNRVFGGLLAQWEQRIEAGDQSQPELTFADAVAVYQGA